MRTIAHLSDLHFGRVDTAILAPLTAFLGTIAPDLVVISADLTQRARSAEFMAARTFLDALPAPRIIVPGNHDIPLHNVLARFVKPLAKYRHYITEELEPFYIDEEIAVMGVNTARSLTIKDGRVNKEQLAQVRARLGSLDERMVKIVVTHHPFDLPTHLDSDDLVGRAPQAICEFAQCGVDLLLAGHLHTSQAVITSERYPEDGRAALAIQAGTATSTRGRGESNSFNILRVQAGHVQADRLSWVPETGNFTRTSSQAFAAGQAGWVVTAQSKTDWAPS